MSAAASFATCAAVASSVVAPAGLPVVNPGEPVTVRPQLDFGAAVFHGYGFGAYLPDIPCALQSLRKDQIRWNKKEPRYSSCPLQKFRSVAKLPEMVTLDTTGLPVGDYRADLSCHVIENGRDRYPVRPFLFAVRDSRRATKPAVPFSVGPGVLAIPRVTGFGGDPTGAVSVDVPWQSDFARIGSRSAPRAETKFKVFHDGDWLYVAIDCEEPTAQTKIATLKRLAHDSVMIAREECVEVNIDPSGAGMSFYKLAIRPTGDFADYRCVDDNTNTGRFVSDLKWESGATVVTHGTERGWRAEAAIPLGPLLTLWEEGRGEPRLSVGRTRLPGDGAEWTAWPRTVKNFMSPKTFARARLQELGIRDHRWEVSVDRTVTVPKSGALAFCVGATLANRSGEFRLVTVTAVLEDINRRRLAAATSHVLCAQADRLVPVELTLADVPKGMATLNVEVRSAEGRLETHVVREVRVSYEPVRIAFTEPCYRDCVFASQKLTSIAGIVTLEEGVGTPLEITLTGPGTSERQSVARAGVTNLFRFAFANKAKGEYFVRAGNVSRRLRNLPFRDGEIWIDRTGAMYRNGERFLPYGWYSDQFTEDYPGITLAQMWADGLTPEATRKLLDTCGRHTRGFITTPHQKLDARERAAFGDRDMKMQGVFTDEQRAIVGRFVDTVKEHPWFLAYYLVDEPEGRDLNPEWLRAEREFIEERDPYHPTMLTNYSIPGIRRYASVGADIYSPDAYPIYFTDGTTRDPRRITYDKAKAASAAGLSAWVVPQLFDWDVDDPAKTPCAPDFDAIREQALLAFAGDARGLFWYSRYSGCGAYTEHMRHTPRLLLEELLETRDVFLSPTRGGLKATSSGPAHSLVTALKHFGGETLIIAANTSDGAVDVTLSGEALPDSLYPNGARTPLVTKKGVFGDRLGRFEAKVYYDRPKKFDFAAARRMVYDLEAKRRKPGNLAAAPRFLVRQEILALKRKLPADWFPRLTASTMRQQTYDLPYTYFLQDGIAEERPITPYLSWSPTQEDAKPWVRCEFGSRKRFSRVVLHRCRDERGRIALVSGRIAAGGRVLKEFDTTATCRLELVFPPVEAESVTLEVGRIEAEAACRLLSEFEVY